MKNSVTDSQESWEGEATICEGRLHWAIFLGPALLILFGGLSVPAKGTPALGLVGMGLAWMVLSYRRWSSSSIRVTDRRIVICTSFLSKRFSSVPIGEISNVDVYRPSLGAILNFGKITIIQGGKTKIVVRMVASPDEVITALQGRSVADGKKK